MSKRSLFQPAATVAGAVIALGLAAPAFAQSPSDKMAECQQLYGQWSKYNGTSSYSKNVGPEMALEDCRKGNYTAGIASLKQTLQRNGIPVPPSQTATVPGK
ncbi:MAG: hypothetical protein JSR91_18165 [Proteobacteria bacterium]|nr:hypothetical protein [Pseudomonadota bacterium]